MFYAHRVQRTNSRAFQYVFFSSLAFCLFFFIMFCYIEASSSSFIFKEKKLYFCVPNCVRWHPDKAVSTDGDIRLSSMKIDWFFGCKKWFEPILVSFFRPKTECKMHLSTAYKLSKLLHIESVLQKQIYFWRHHSWILNTKSFSNTIEFERTEFKSKGIIIKMVNVLTHLVKQI